MNPTSPSLFSYTTFAYNGASQNQSSSPFLLNLSLQ